MRWNDTLTLVAVADGEINAHGLPVGGAETLTTVYADKRNVGYRQFYTAAAAGMTAELKFAVRSVDYSDQRFAEYGGVRYRVQRTYLLDSGENVELTLDKLPTE